MGIIVNFILIITIIVGIIEGQKKGLWYTLVPFISFAISYIIVSTVGKICVEGIMNILGIEESYFTIYAPAASSGPRTISSFLEIGNSITETISYYTSSMSKSICSLIIVILAGVIRKVLYMVKPKHMFLMSNIDRLGGSIAGIIRSLIRIWAFSAILEILISLNITFVTEFYNNLFNSFLFRMIASYNPLYRLL